MRIRRSRRFAPGSMHLTVSDNRIIKGGDGGEGGIRTHGTREGTTVFETVPIDHSGTSPQQAYLVVGGL